MKRSAPKVDAQSILTAALLESTALVDTVRFDDVVKALGKTDTKGKARASFVALPRVSAHERSSDGRAVALHSHLVAQRASLRKQIRSSIAAFELPPATSTARATTDAEVGESDDEAAPSSSKPAHPAARLKSRPTTLPDKSGDRLKGIDEVLKMLDDEKHALEHEIGEIEGDIARLHASLEACVRRSSSSDAHRSLNEVSTIEIPDRAELDKRRKQIAQILAG